MRLVPDFTPKVRSKVFLAPGTPEYERQRALECGKLKPLVKCVSGEPRPPKAA